MPDLTAQDIQAMTTRPAFTEATRISMEARFERPRTETIDGNSVLLAICASCRQLAQCSMMQMGHKVKWKDYVLGKMQPGQTIPQAQLDEWFNDLDNLHWEHSVCNTGHSFEEFNPFDVNNPYVREDDKVKALLSLQFIKDYLAVEGKSVHELKAMTVETFHEIASRRFELRAADVDETKLDGMTLAKAITEVPAPDPDFNLKKITRKQMVWFPETAPALFKRWNANKLVRTSGQTRYYKCMSCKGWNEASGMQRGHITPWKTYLAKRDVQSLKAAKIAYNDLDNLQWECSTCNGAHDWEIFSEDEQNTIDNALMALGRETQDYTPEDAKAVTLGILGGKWDIVPPEFFLQRGISNLAKSQAHQWETAPSEEAILQGLAADGDDDPETAQLKKEARQLFDVVRKARTEPSPETMRYFTNLKLGVLCGLAYEDDPEERLAAVAPGTTREELARLRDCLENPDAYILRDEEIVLGGVSYPVGRVLAEDAQTLGYDDWDDDAYTAERGKLTDNGKAILEITNRIATIFEDDAGTTQKAAFQLIWKAIQESRSRGMSSVFDDKVFAQEATAIKLIRKVFQMWRDEWQAEEYETLDQPTLEQVTAHARRKKRMQKNNADFTKISGQDEPYGAILNIAYLGFGEEEEERFGDEDDPDRLRQSGSSDHEDDSDEDDNPPDPGGGGAVTWQDRIQNIRNGPPPVFAQGDAPDRRTEPKGSRPLERPDEANPRKAKKLAGTTDVSQNREAEEEDDEDEEDLDSDAMEPEPKRNKRDDDRDPPPPPGAGTSGSGSAMSSTSATSSSQVWGSSGNSGGWQGGSYDGQQTTAHQMRDDGAKKRALSISPDDDTQQAKMPRDGSRAAKRRLAPTHLDPGADEALRQRWIALLNDQPGL